MLSCPEKNKEKRLKRESGYNIEYQTYLAIIEAKKKSKAGNKPSTRYHLTDTYSLQREFELVPSG